MNHSSDPRTRKQYLDRAGEWLEWASAYNGYQLLASGPAELERLLAPARASWKRDGVVPDWVGAHLLRGWLFLLYRIDYFAGGHLFERDDTAIEEWDGVVHALLAHPVAAADPALRVPARLLAVRAPMTPMYGGPRQHRDPVFLAAKQARLREPHVAPVQQLVDEIRLAQPGAHVPYVDPDSGGIHARVLFLLEAPAAAAATRSGMLSPDNDDGTAANMWRLYRSSGLRRDQCAHWNAVPWYIGDGVRIRAAGGEDIEHGGAWLARLVAVLPDLQLVITMGGAARDGFGRYLTREDALLLRWIPVAHPSQRVFNVMPHVRERIERAFQVAADVAEGRTTQRPTAMLDL